MQQCYHQVCDSSEANRQLKFANVKFLTKTCQALIDTLVTLSQSQCLADDVLKPIESESTSHSHGHRIAPVLANFLVVFLTILHWIGVLWTILTAMTKCSDFSFLSYFMYITEKNGKIVQGVSLYSVQPDVMPRFHSNLPSLFRTKFNLPPCFYHSRCKPSPLPEDLRYKLCYFKRNYITNGFCTLYRPAQRWMNTFF